MGKIIKQQDLAWEIGRLLGIKNRKMDDKTRAAKIQRQERIAEIFKAEGLQTIYSMRARHIESYLRIINNEHKAGKGRGQDLKPGSLALHLTELRDIARAIGKQNIMHRDNAYYSANRPDSVRHNPQTLNQTGYTTSMAAMAKVKHGETFTTAKATGDVLGLRRREQLYSKDMLIRLPDGRFLASQRSSAELHEISHEGLMARYRTGIGNYLDSSPVGVPCAIVEGAKTGQRRLIPLDSDEKLAAMELRMAYIRDNNLTSMMPAGLSAKQAETAYRNALHRAGFTRANECNNHAARHYFAQQEIASGKSRWEVSLSLGHHRLSILASYVPRNC